LTRYSSFLEDLMSDLREPQDRVLAGLGQLPLFDRPLVKLRPTIITRCAKSVMNAILALLCCLLTVICEDSLYRSW